MIASARLHAWHHGVIFPLTLRWHLHGLSLAPAWAAVADSARAVADHSLALAAVGLAPALAAMGLAPALAAMAHSARAVADHTLALAAVGLALHRLQWLIVHRSWRNVK